ncbi:hypothetical protein AXG93_3822s1200 [Marchantia polymorpha subsp. ruderalis]|uniref:Phosphate acetyltransferase n=1 Tax=Marchantia polymorpha subsp. ruderalis TaxID=1480154 RepID=A0A176WKS3_MARPO|nr:hypothetical protein AXG93_3822s1200 [Marchantia polymorpha subsp. ruderalis]
MWRISTLRRLAKQTIAAHVEGFTALSWNPRRLAHTGLYIHHTNPGSGRESIAASLGLLHALDRLQPGMGYFRPIDKTTIGGQRAAVMKRIFGFQDEEECMIGVTQNRAFELITMDKTDDLMEEIYKAFEEIRKRHDFLVVEGTSLKGWGGDVVNLNATMASMLGTSAMFFTNARGAMQGEINRSKEEWEREILESAKVSNIAFKRQKVDVLGAIVHGMPAKFVDVDALKKQFEEIHIAFAGAIPEDPLFHSLQVQDVARTLDAELLFGVQDLDTSMSTEVTNFIVATLQLSDLLKYLPNHCDPSKGSVVIADSSRSDILLSLLHLHESKSFSSVAALVLTGGQRPDEHIELLVKDQAAKGSLPVLLSPLPSFETCALLSKAEAKIGPESYRKIERAQLNFEENVNMEIITKALLEEQPIRMNPKLFIHNLFARAKVNKQHIVLPEGEEPRTVQAAGVILRRDICEITLLGNKQTIQTIAKQFRVDISQARIVDPTTAPRTEAYRDFFYETRKHKGITKEQAYDTLITDCNYYGTCMVALGDADGMVSGALNTTANTVRPALQIIKTSPSLPLVSSVLFMCLLDKILVYGDCAINSNPTSQELAAIAIQSADTATSFGIEPRVAMLSYATGNSNTGPLIQKVIDATAIAKKKRPDLLIEGPLQYDAAVNIETARTKLKGKDNPVAGKATVLIFPDLNTGNNTYKAVQQSTGAVAVGPLLQGLRKPVNDLSRGCTVTDIVTTIAMTAVQAVSFKKNVEKTSNEKIRA